MAKYIDADQLLLHLSDYALQESPGWGANGYGNQDAYEAIVECIKEIEAQPAADVRPAQPGHWKYLTKPPYGVVECSVCKAKIYIRKEKPDPYCCMCGAKMQEMRDAERNE